MTSQWPYLGLDRGIYQFYHLVRIRYVFLAIFTFFGVLSPKIVVVLAENQYLGRFKGGHDVTMTIFRPR